MNNEILNTIREKGLLLEREVYEIVNRLNVEIAKEFLEQLERVSGKKIITKNILSRNMEYMKKFVGKLGEGEKDIVEKTFINLGLSLEVRREKEIIREDDKTEQEKDYKIFNFQTEEKKLEVKDFTGYFRARYNQLQRILMNRIELQRSLVSINKISSERTSISIIGMVKEKRITKNKNLIIRFEDLTGEINVLVKFDDREIYNKARELQLDDVVGVKASGSRDILFARDIFFPDMTIYEKTKFEEEKCVAFISDIHCGSDRHLGRNFRNFLEWINRDNELVKKIKYLFFIGDNVDGVGIFPGQEAVLKLKSMEEQYSLLADYLRKIPRNIKMFLCPGRHDAVRVAEPQPRIGKKYGKELYEIENLELVTNPCRVELFEKDKKFKVLMYHGASIHSFINNIQELREMKAHSCPAKAVKHMLKRRHLAPTHSEIVYIPHIEKDFLVIDEVPDLICIGEVHRLDVDNYNNILIITGSCWQAQTPFEEKIGNVPDPCKVPVLNLKTRELKIFDFSGGGDEY